MVEKRFISSSVCRCPSIASLDLNQVSCILLLQPREPTHISSTALVLRFPSANAPRLNACFVGWGGDVRSWRGLGTSKIPRESNMRPLDLSNLSFFSHNTDVPLSLLFIYAANDLDAIPGPPPDCVWGVTTLYITLQPNPAHGPPWIHGWRKVAVALKNLCLWLKGSLELGMADVQIHSGEPCHRRQGSVRIHTYKSYSEAIMRPR
ncbi:hypothetical protein P691DRAFT_517128 [Macrolepiota fuliginosa MF-IS2]|uniref:Uncharacterized protein n=1 Tax=Macrolepiota fuliginosa MF-IS2 TaxID=1400762 RepID=A0A9P5X0I4_9AGAR|nr:hypothetical protein P691DRAFT_517128 [Macrolepiota fuliginosa MF-IS2]